MIKIYDCENFDINSIVERKSEGASAEVEKVVDEIIANVRKNGDKAVLEYVERFDGVKLDSLRVSEDEIEAAYNSIDAEFINILETAKRNIWAFHEKQIRRDYVMNEREGVVLGQRIIPLDRVGLYVPGGTASYPSSVLMDAIPAKIAGVREVIMTTPVGKDGKINPAILAAAKIADVSAIYKTGGAGAVAALAYGTQSIPKVDKIVGPGNIFVATAKRKVYGIVDIDMIAGPSDILVIADDTANPVYVAADMLSQAEHDKLSSAVLVCTSEELANNVAKEIERQLLVLPREEIARAAIEGNSMIIITKTMRDAVEISNKIAPEHLEICVDEPFALLGAVKNAGSIFLGKNVPEALGDYLAGPNHTLPTEGTSRFSSPLSVDDFVKKSSFIYYTKEALMKDGEMVIKFAEKEGLDAHARSVAARMELRRR